MTEPTTIPLSSIIEGERERKEYGDLKKLSESISAIGLIQPIVLAREGETYSLVAGGRRLRALQLLGVTELAHGVTCDPTRPGFVFNTELTDDQRLEIELEENLQRKNMHWTEEVLLIAKTHRAKQRNAALAGQTWGVRQTGQLLKQSSGQISHVLTVADHIKQNDEEILQCTSLNDALKKLLQRKEDEASARLAQLTGANMHAVPNGKPKLRSGTNISIEVGDFPLDTPSSDADAASSDFSINLEELGVSPTTRSENEHHAEGEVEGYDGVLEIPLSRMFFLGDSIVGPDGKPGSGIMFQLPEKSVDHIVTDIPYGIPMENLEVNDLERVRAEHDVDQNVELMLPFLQGAYRLIKDNGYLVFWYDLDHHEKLMNWGEEVGFKVQHWPLIWIKSHPTKNRVAQFNWTKRTEYAMVMRKGMATLTKQQSENWIMADGSVERKMYGNPFAKPFEVWKWIYDAIAIRGQTVYDPFAGEFSACRAAVNCGLRPMGSEKVELHFNNGIEHMRSLWMTLTRKKAKFV